MLSLKVGDGWRARGGPPRDSLGLEIDGVPLLPAIDDAELVSSLFAWLDALAALIVERAPTAQVSLEEAQLELCLVRRPGLTLELTVVRLEPTPGLAGRPVLIDLVELKGAVDQAVRQFARAGREAGIDATVLVELERRLRAASGRAIAPFAAAAPTTWKFEQTIGPLALSLEDTDGRTAQVTRGASLAALLTSGALRIDGTTSREPPFLALLGVVRRQPSRAAFELGLALCAALHERHPGWTRSPWVDALFVRCTEGLAGLKAPTPSDAPAEPSPRRVTTELPLAAVGSPRRVSLRPRWTRTVALGEPKGRLSLSSKAVVVHSAHAAHVFSTKGKELRRASASRGVSAAADGVIVTASEDTLTCLAPGQLGARWARDSGGVRIGPELECADGQLRTRLSGRGLIAFASLTGMELWRFDPPRAQRSSFVRVGTRLVLGADSGDLYGVDAADGLVRFRIRGMTGVPWPSVALQRDALVVLSTGGQTVVVRYAALSGGAVGQPGAIAWSRTVPLDAPSRPVVARSRTFIAGLAEGRGAVACLSSRGEVLWLRPVPLDGATTSVVPFERGVIATDARGAAVRLLPDGDTSWVLGGQPEPLMRRLAPTISRGTLVVPGTSVRLVEPISGRVLSATPDDPELADYAVGRGLALYTYSEPGSLTCFELGAVLSVV